MKLKTSRFDLHIRRHTGIYRRTLSRSSPYQRGTIVTWRIDGKAYYIVQLEASREWVLRLLGSTEPQLLATRSFRTLLTYLALHASL